MTLPHGFKPPKKKEISDNKEFGNNNNTTNKKNNSLTDEILQSATLDDTINKVLERSNEVVTNLEDTVKEVIEKGKGEENKDMTENSTNNSEDYKIQRKDESIKDKIYRKMSEFIGETKREDNESLFHIKLIIFGLFALIGFIILVYSIFIGVVGEPLASIADTVFVAALIGSFTMVGIIVSYSFLKK